MRIRFTRPALDDLSSILLHVRVHSATGASRVRARLRATLDLVAEHPGLGTSTEEPGIRRIAVAPFPYLVFFEPTRDEVVVHAVRHGARDLSGFGARR